MVQYNTTQYNALQYNEYNTKKNTSTLLNIRASPVLATRRLVFSKTTKTVLLITQYQEPPTHPHPEKEIIDSQ